MDIRRALPAVALAMALAGCASPASDVSPPTTPTSPGTGTSAPPASSAPAGSGPAGAPAPTPAEPLTDFEEALAKTWRRYHVANRGHSNEYEYYEYVSFNENRTACRWKYGEKSSTASTDEVFDSSDYSHWRIAEQLSGGGASFRVVVEGRGLDYVFDFAKNRVTPAGFDTLVFVPNTDGKSCLYRHGASF